MSLFPHVLNVSAFKQQVGAAFLGYTSAGVALQSVVLAEDTLIPMGIFIGVLVFAVTATVKAVRTFDRVSAQLDRLDEIEKRLRALEPKR